MKTTRRGFLAAAVATLTATSTHMADNTPTFDLDREDPGADGWTDRMNSNFTDIETLLTGGSVNGENPSISPDQVGSIELVKPGENIQTAVDNVQSNGGGLVLLDAGTHDITGYNPVQINSGNVYVTGLGPGSQNPTIGSHHCLVDANGGDAFEVNGGGGGSAYGFGITDMSIKGRVFFSVTGFARDYVLRNLNIFGADSALNSGRGLEIDGVNSFQQEITNIAANDCDGAGIYIGPGAVGQTRVGPLRGGKNAETVDNFQMYLGGGETTYINPYCADAPGTDGSRAADGMVLAGFRNTYLAPTVERCIDGITIAEPGTTSNSSGHTIVGGASFGNDGDGVVFGDGVDSDAQGILFSGMQLQSNGGVDLNFESSLYVRLGFVQGPAGQKNLNDVSIDGTGSNFQNQLAPGWLTAATGGTGIDVSTTDPPANFSYAVEKTDGTNSTSGNKVWANWDESAGAWVLPAVDKTV